MNRLVKALLMGVCLSFSAEILYKGEPVNVEVSNRDFSVFVFPEKVERVVTTEGLARAKAKGNEVLVSVVDYQGAALWVKLKDGKTYLFYLIPSEKPPEQFKVIDVRKKEKKIPEIEKKTPHEELIAQLIKSTILGKVPIGYEENIKVYAIDTPKLLIVTEGYYDGYFYRVWKAKIINKTDEIVRIREDMKFFERIIRKEWGRPYALAITTEYLKPDDEYALMIAVVRKEDIAGDIRITEHDEIIKDFLLKGK